MHTHGRRRAAASLALVALTGCPPGPSPPPSPPVLVPAPATPVPATPSTATPAPTAAAPTVGDWPTDDEVKALVHKVEEEIRASETNRSVWKVTGVQHEFHEIKRGARTVTKPMRKDALPEICYPVHVSYTRITTYSTKDPVREESDPTAVAFFYRDSFGAWKLKFGNE